MLWSKEQWGLWQTAEYMSYLKEFTFIFCIPYGSNKTCLVHSFSLMASHLVHQLVDPVFILPNTVALWCHPKNHVSLQLDLDSEWLSWNMNLFYHAIDWNMLQTYL